MQHNRCHCCFADVLATRMNDIPTGTARTAGGFQHCSIIAANAYTDVLASGVCPAPPTATLASRKLATVSAPNAVLSYRDTAEREAPGQ